MSTNGNAPGEGGEHSVGNNATESTQHPANAQAQNSIGTCQGCGTHTVLMPLHGPRGGPARCPLCIGKWNAEPWPQAAARPHRHPRHGGIHGRGRQQQHKGDILNLYYSAIGIDLADLFGNSVDPLGYLEGSAQLGGEQIELTSELLADALKLAHPDHHPPERQELAHRTTQGLLALKPFVFPAPKPKPVAPPEPKRNGSSEVAREPSTKPTRPAYPCADCRGTVPSFYCDTCKAEWDKRRDAEREQEAAKRHKWYERRKARRLSRLPPILCATCDSKFEGKRKDARFCSDACRQKAHRSKAVTGKNKSMQGSISSRNADAEVAS